jgi:hypothetical protein
VQEGRLDALGAKPRGEEDPGQWSFIEDLHTSPNLSDSYFRNSKILKSRFAHPLEASPVTNSPDAKLYLTPTNSHNSLLLSSLA